MYSYALHMQNYTTPSIQNLETLAFEQHGYFTGPQAREHGVSRQLLHHYVQGGRFDKIRRGLLLQPDQLELAIRQAIQRGIVIRRQLIEEAEGHTHGSAVTRALEAIGR